MSFGKYTSGRFPILVPVCVALGGAALFAVSGCNRQSAPSAPSVVANPPAATPAFQPYTVLTQPPPTPTVVTHLHQKLRLIQAHNRTVLADSGGRVYDVGRDASGRIYPIYRTPGDGRVYPLYYDSARDRYYRVVKDDRGHFLRGYADDPQNQYYVADRDYENYNPGYADRPIITNYNTGGYYHPNTSLRHSSHHNDWLWAIPVVVGAYFLLRPHHASPPPIYPHRPAYVHSIPGAPLTQINSNNRTISNNHIVNNYYNHPFPSRPVLAAHTIPSHPTPPPPRNWIHRTSAKPFAPGTIRPRPAPANLAHPAVITHASAPHPTPPPAAVHLPASPPKLFKKSLPRPVGVQRAAKPLPAPRIALHKPSPQGARIALHKPSPQGARIALHKPSPQGARTPVAKHMTPPQAPRVHPSRPAEPPHYVKTLRTEDRSRPASRPALDRSRPSSSSPSARPSTSPSFSSSRPSTSSSFSSGVRSRR